jgi:hypothetical protein
MQRFSLPPIRPGWLEDLNSFLFSAICHLVALVVLGLLSLSNQRGWTEIKLLAQISDGYDAPTGGNDLLQDDLAQFALAGDESAAAAGPVTIFDSSAISISEVAELATPLDALRGGDGLEGQSIGVGTGDLAAGGPGDAEFFGVSGYGGSFVYVVDISGSMNESGKYERARDELLRSIEHLYNDGWYPMDADAPILATATQIEKTRRWVRRVWPNGGTYPLEALLHALRLGPDAIYFLSDGRFDPATIDALRIHNPASTSQIPIHTIAFVNQETVGIMKTIARNSGGKFRFVE